MTKKTKAVLSALLAEPDKELYGLEIYERTGLTRIFRVGDGLA